MHGFSLAWIGQFYASAWPTETDERAKPDYRQNRLNLSRLISYGIADCL
jgi:hypothetical protein